MQNPDNFKRINTSDIYAPLLNKLDQLITNCKARGAHYYATSGYRSVDEQNELWAQGRSKPGKIVTHAKGGQSYHNYKIAVDFTADADPSKDGLQPSWQNADYNILGEEAEKLGLEWGGSWVTFQDRPHVQLKVRIHNVGLAELYAAYKNGSQAGVKALLDGYNW